MVPWRDMDALEALYGTVPCLAGPPLLADGRSADSGKGGRGLYVLGAAQLVQYGHAALEVGCWFWFWFWFW
ncbi:hypothetical protein V8C35DRAFT_300991, partial [Trichoderma chlorosporum]